ncbi:hypothetical protein RCIP0012_00210 [Klebsiella phage RCIP0012]
MKMSNEGRKVTKYFESLKLRAYPDPATGVSHGLSGMVTPGQMFTLHQFISFKSPLWAFFFLSMERAVY